LAIVPPTFQHSQAVAHVDPMKKLFTPGRSELVIVVQPLAAVGPEATDARDAADAGEVRVPAATAGSATTRAIEASLAVPAARRRVGIVRWLQKYIGFVSVPSRAAAAMPVDIREKTAAALLAPIVENATERSVDRSPDSDFHSEFTAR
jgi:hypothetical protein